MRYLCLLLVVHLSSFSAYSSELKVIRKDHPMDRYTISVLKLVVSKLDGKYTMKEIPAELTQERTIEMVQQGDVDVYWMASSPEAERLLLPVRFPLMKGLLGHRISIINREDQARFDQIKSLQDAKRVRFGQGRSWPDTKILRSNNFEVVTSNKYQGLFHMVDGGRFDAFPRGVLEAWSEVAGKPELDLAVEKKLLFVYRLPVYFFVREDRKELAADLREALDRSLQDGSMDEFFFSNPLIKDALEKSDLKDRIAFYLENPLLPKETPVDRAEYWLNLDSL